MYKVFVNEKRLSISSSILEGVRNILYESSASLEMAVDLLENTSTPAVNVHGLEYEEVWKTFNSLFTIIEAAGGIVENTNKEILFIKRLGKWDLPKGKIEKNESLGEAALREVSEETSLTQIKLGKFLTTTYHIYTERNSKKVLKFTHWFSMSYAGSETPQPQLEEGITETVWKSKNNIHTTVVGNTFQNIELLLKDFHFAE